MIDQLSQVGAAAWRPLVSTRSGAPPPPRKLQRLERVAIEAAKQCGRAWLLEIGPPASLPDVLGAGGTVAILDGSGAPLVPTTDNVTLLVGPEGGWNEAELDQARLRQAQIARIGPLTLRIETAAAVGVALASAER